MSLTNYAHHVGTQALATWVTEDGVEDTAEGRVVAGSTVGVVLRIAGRRGPLLIEAGDLMSFEPITKRTLRQRVLPPVTEGTAREHLVDRHGLFRHDVEPLSDEEALNYHDRVDHEALGHRHRVSI